MPSIEVLIAFTTAALVMNMSPGPSNLYVMARAIAQGARGGIAAAAGLATGSLVHVAAAVLGLSALFVHSPTLYTIIKLIGAGYLVYLGINYWRSSFKGTQESAPSLAEKPLTDVFRESVLVEITNPKTALFFLAFLPQFVTPEQGPVAPQLLILGLIVTLSAIPCDILVAVSSSRVAAWLLRHPAAPAIQDRISGTILFGMGAYIAIDEMLESES